MVTVKEISGYLEGIAPLSLAEAWDNVGLQVGREKTDVKSLIICLDMTDSIIDTATSKNCQMIITHHPLFFGNITSLADSTNVGRLAIRSIESGLAVYAAHTNLDKAVGGISDCLASRLGLEDVRVLQSRDNLLKLVVFVPKEALGKVRESLGDAGAGKIGLYSHCSFSSPGSGAFRAGPGTHQSVGEIGKDNIVDEVKLEVEVGKEDLGPVIKAMVAAHPYEEVAYDVFEQQKTNRRTGLGRVGYLKSKQTMEDFLDTCRTRISKQLRLVGHTDLIKKVAVCGGSGASLIESSKEAGADVLVTGDIKYHDAQKAVELGLVVVDAGHDATEIAGLEDLGDNLEAALDVKVWPDFSESIWRAVE